MQAKKIIAIISLGIVLFACKSKDTRKDEPKSDDDLILIRCESNPPERIDYREGKKFIEMQGTVDLEGKPCGQVASAKYADKIKTVKTGLWTNYHRDSDKIQSKGNYIANKREGKWETFSETGNLANEVSYKGGKKEGRETTYFDTPDKQWKNQGAYTSGKKSGKWQFRKAANSTCVQEGNYTNGEKDGKWRECQKNAKTKTEYISFEGIFKDGLKHGPATYFYPDGKPQSKGEMSTVATCIARLSDAEKESDERRESCVKRTGKWTVFHSNGKKFTEGSYDNDGRKTGEWREYYSNGKAMASGSYNGRKKGIWKYSLKNGSVYAEFSFENSDHMPKWGKFYEGGKVTGEGDLSMTIVGYDQAKDEFTVDSLTKKGAWVEYHKNGKKSGEGTYSMNKRKGIWKHYDESGKLIGEGPYSMGEKQGDWRELKDNVFVTNKYFQGTLQKTTY